MRISNEKFEAIKREYDKLARKYFHATAMELQKRNEWRGLSETFPNTSKDALLFLLDDSLLVLGMGRTWLFQDIGIADTAANEAAFYNCLESGLSLEDFLTRIGKP